MPEEAAGCSCIIDCDGLLIAATTQINSLKDALLGRLSSGEIGVPMKVWREFCDAYPDEAEQIKQHVTYKYRMSRAAHANVGRLAEQLNSGLSRGPYDQHSDLFTAAAADIAGFPVLTVAARISFYSGLGCTAIDVADWASGLP